MMYLARAQFFLISRSHVVFGVFLRLQIVPQQIPALAMKAEWLVLVFAIGEMSHQVEKKGREGRVKLLS